MASLLSILRSPQTFHWTSPPIHPSLPSAFFPASSTPFSSPHLLLLTIAIYLLCVLLLSNLPPLSFPHTRSFTLLAFLHNLSLALLSLYMLLTITYTLTTLPFAQTLCNPPSTPLPPHLAHALYIFYLSKFPELLDTVLLLLRGRPPTLLHTFHHASVLVEMYTWLEYDFALGAYGMAANTLVHTFMYSHYAATLLRVPVPWKRALTTMQIAQFCASFAALVPYAYVRASRPEGCSGGVALGVSAFCNAAFLILFIRFYRKTYRRAEKKDA